MVTCRLGRVILCCAIVWPSVPVWGQESVAHRWEEAIAAFQQQDRQQPPEQNGILFVGSSSIRLWDLPASFAGQTMLNRGFGGSHMSDVLFFADRIILPYRPRLVFLYVGDNDIAAGKSPQEVSRDFAQLAARIHAELPTTQIVFLSIKPSLARWSLFPQMQQANRRIRQLVEQDERLHFIDVGPAMLGTDGLPRKKLFREDGLHLNEAGYRCWAELVRPWLTQIPPPPAAVSADSPAD